LLLLFKKDSSSVSSGLPSINLNLSFRQLYTQRCNATLVFWVSTPGGGSDDGGRAVGQPGLNVVIILTFLTFNSYFCVVLTLVLYIYIYFFFGQMSDGPKKKEEKKDMCGLGKWGCSG